MKKLSMMLLVTAMAFQLAACANSAGSQSASGETSAAQTAATEVQQETGLAETAAAGGDVSAETAADAPETVVIKSYNANKEEIDLEVPYNPQRIAILDMASLDILDNLGLGDRVVGTASTSLDYLLSYAENENISNLGTIKEADMEAVMACEPDVIFIGGRLSASYDALSEIAPVVYLSTDTEIGAGPEAGYFML